MSDHRISVSELSDRDDFVLASAADTSLMPARGETPSPCALRKDRLKPNNRWRAYLETRKA